MNSFFFFLPEEAGVAMGTQASPCPVAVDTDSNILARKAEIGWTRREDTPTPDSSAREGKHEEKKCIRQCPHFNVTGDSIPPQ